jgi:FtsZ-binding cell division protein ZapB
MMKAMIKKVEKLDSIDTRVKMVESDLKSVKESIEFAHAEIRELKKDNETRKKTDETTKERIEKLEKENEILNKSVNDLKSRSMRDNLIFYNIPESKDEDTTNIIHKLHEENLHLEDASKKIEIDRSHRLGRQKQGAEKPRPIIAKFNFYQDRENIRLNAKKLIKGFKHSNRRTIS